MLTGEGPGDTGAYRSGGLGLARVGLLNRIGGDLAFRVADTKRLPATLVEQVAGPDDALRADVTAYRLNLPP